MPDHVTTIEVRHKGVSWDVAYERALDAAQTLVVAGYDVTLKPTLPDEPLSSPEDIRRMLDGEGEE